MTKCIRCEKTAVVPPLCLACLLDIDEKEYQDYKRLEAALKVLGHGEDEYSHECSMCGKDCLRTDENGHCSTCRQIWNG